MLHPDAKQLISFLQTAACRPIQIHDAVIEFIEILIEEPWGAVYCPTHTHTWFEFNYIFEGFMLTGFGEEPPLDVNAQEFFLIPPGQEHYHRYNPEHPHLGVCLRWTVNPAASSDSQKDEHSLQDKLDSLRHWQRGCYPDLYGFGDLINRLFAEKEHLDDPISIRLHLTKLLLELSKIRNPQLRRPNMGRVENHAIVRKVDIYFGDDQGKQIDVHKLAASLHMSYGHLARRYKQLTGKTLLERLTEIRLERSKELLKNTSYSIQQIAEKSGFSSIYYFIRVFSKSFGISPGRFRQAAKKSK